eukprot:665138-Pelagomonas_calceolata.AAC.3
MAPPSEAVRVRTRTGVQGKCGGSEQDNAACVLGRRMGSDEDKAACVQGKEECLQGRMQGGEGQGLVERECVEAQGCNGAGDEHNRGAQGSCSNEEGEEGEHGKGDVDDQGGRECGHGLWGEGPVSAKHGTLVSASRDGSIAVWHVFPP